MSFVVGKPKLINKSLFMKRVEDIIDSQVWSNNGPYVKKLEDALSEYFGVDHVIAVNNATIGLQLALEGCKHYYNWLYELEKEQTLTCLVPSFTFIATVSALVNTGIMPLYGDIDNDYCLDVKELEDGLEPEYDMVMPVNVFGNLCDREFNMDMLRPTVFDNAHSTGVYNESESAYVGADCMLGVSSLHCTKILSGFEGGFITCADSDTATYIRELRNFGYQINSGVREGNVIHLSGTNAKMSEIQAAMALTQLENIQEIQEVYFNNHKEYERLLPDIIKPKNNNFSNYSYVIGELDNRDRIIDELNKDNIFPRSYFKPVHHMEAYRQNVSLPNTERIAQRIIAFPTGLDISKKDIEFICDKVNKAIINVR